MAVQEQLLEETLSSRNMKDEEEFEETLSLCDLPLYSDQSADWDQEFSLNSNSNSTSSSSQDDYFEFFSQELDPSATKTAVSFPPENIVFCGKLIPYKQVTSPCKTDHSNQAEIKKSSRWRLKSLINPSKNSKRQSSVSKNGNKGTTALMQQPPYRKMYNSKQLGKAKWYLFVFGISSFSPVVELSDIRSRQSRRRSPPMSPTWSPAPPTMLFGLENDKASDRRWGLRGLIKALSCGGNNHPTAAPAVALE